LSNALIQIPDISSGSDQAAPYLAMTSFGIPLTGSMSGFTIGFIKG
jgi:hypothetical protein